MNSANPFMSRGGGICGIIHKAECSEFAEINHFIRIAFPFFLAGIIMVIQEVMHWNVPKKLLTHITQRF